MVLLENILKKTSVWAVAAVCALAVSACNSAPSVKDSGEASDQDSDPLEPLNRAVFEFNHGLDVALLKPIALGYREIMPEQGRTMVSHAVSNIYEPVVFVNSVLQGDPQNSFATLWRFLLNSTAGVGGLFDVASEVGLKNHQTDLGQTLAVYGVDSGPYIVLPIIGPSNGRDAIGRLGDMFANPLSYGDNWVYYTALGVTLLDARTNNLKLVDNVYSSSLDPYATFRSGYTQRRIAEIRNTKAERKKARDAAFGDAAVPVGSAVSTRVFRKVHKKSAKKIPDVSSTPVKVN